MKKDILAICLLFLIVGIFFGVYYIKDSYSLPSSETDIINAKSLTDVSKYSTASSDNSFYSVNVETGQVSDGSFNDFEGDDFSSVVGGSNNLEEKKEKVTEYLNDSELYTINKTNDDKVLEVVAVYSNKRIKVITNDKDITTFGASGGVHFKNYYILSYKTDEQTKDAYEALKSKYGEDKVILDIPLKASSARGWGTSFMSFDSKLIDLDLTNNVTIAVLDTGINKNHNIFNGHTILTGKNIITGSSNTMDDNGHGTAVSGIISESTGSNISILPIKVLDSRGNGSLLDVLTGLEYANSNNAKIANMSLALNLYESSNSSEKLDDTILTSVNSMEDDLSKFSLFMVCASGNEGLNSDIVYSYPAASSYTVSVGSINKNEKKSSFSNYGQSVDFTAPGEDITIANYSPTNSYKISSGTSFSAPYISAAAGIVLTEYPNYSNLKLKNYLINISKDLGTTGKDDKYGNGVPIFNKDEDFSDDYFIEKYNATLSNESFEYDGTYKCALPILKDSDNNVLDSSNYSVSCFNNRDAGMALVTITGKNNYYGTLIKRFSIEKAKLAGRVVLSSNNYIYDGKAKTPTVTVYDTNNNVINPKYYNIYYSNNVNAGIATVTVSGKTNYYGSLTQKFNINKASITSSQLSLSKANYVYAGKAIKPTFSLLQNGSVVGGSNYSVSYTNNIRIGTSTITLTGKNNYYGTLRKTFKIIPKKPTIKRIKKYYYSKKVKIKIKKTNDYPTGYQIKYKKKGSSWKYKYITSRSFKIKKLKKNKKYYVKVRSYKTVNGTKYYSSWSKSYKFKL